MNLVAVAKFFHIICNALFVSLLAAGKLKRGLVRPISNYFAMFKTNNHSILHLHWFIWLKKALHLVTLLSQIQDNHNFRQKLLVFLEHVINCSVCPDLHPETLHHTCPNANKPITRPPFASLLKSDSKFVARKVQMHSPSHNPTCYKYNTRKSKVCRFYFPRPTLLTSQIDLNRTI